MTASGPAVNGALSTGALPAEGAGNGCTVTWNRQRGMVDGMGTVSNRTDEPDGTAPTAAQGRDAGRSGDGRPPSESSRPSGPSGPSGSSEPSGPGGGSAPSSPGAPGPSGASGGAAPVHRPWSMSYAPPWVGGVQMTALFLAAAILITYTLLPLPGQRSLGWVNYAVATALFVVNVVFARAYRALEIRRRRRARAAAEPAATTPAAPENSATTGKP